MARIARSEYPKIQHMAEVERRKVPEIATLYGCTPANIYSILAKLRKEGSGTAEMASPEPAVVSEQPAAIVASTADTSCPEAVSKAPDDLFAALDEAAITAQPEAASPQGEVPAQPESQSGVAAAQPETQLTAPRAEASIPATAPEVRPAAPSPAKTSARVRGTEVFINAGPRNTKASRPGFALCMRTLDGDESSTPFRSLDDLLSAIRPILRSAARSPDPIWFSIQPVDLAEMDSEAA